MQTNKLYCQEAGRQRGVASGTPLSAALYGPRAARGCPRPSPLARAKTGPE